MKILKVLLCCATVAALPAHAQKACSKADAAAAEKAIERVVSWQSLNKAYNDYRHCDSGPVEESFTDAILRLMVEWKNVDALAASTTKDGDYKEWLHKHLLSPAAKDDRDSVYSRAKKDCPAKQDAFCAELADVVKKTGGGAGKAKAADPANAPIDFAPMTPLTPSTK